MAAEIFDGLILREETYSETGKRLIVLAKGIGKITLTARGAKSAKSPLAAPTQLFSYSSFSAYRNRNFYNAVAGDLIESFYDIRIDFEKMSYASVISEITEKSIPEGIESDEILHLVLITFAVLSGTDFPPRLASVIFQIKLLGLLGFMAESGKCAVCGKNLDQEKKFFSSRAGGVICGGCSPKINGGMPLIEGTAKAIDFVLSNNGKKMFAFNVSEEVLKQLETVMWVYIRNHISPSLNSVNFIKKLNFNM